MPYATDPLAPHHDRAAFSCGVESLDRYLRQQARQDERRNVARVFVMADPDTDSVAGYYTLSMTSIELIGLPDDLTRRLPRYPVVPAALIGRLAVDQRFHGRGLGSILLLDAYHRSLEASAEVAAVAVVIDAIDDTARRFYKHHDFRPLTGGGQRLFLPMATIAKLFGGESDTTPNPLP